MQQKCFYHHFQHHVQNNSLPQFVFEAVKFPSETLQPGEQRFQLWTYVRARVDQLPWHFHIIGDKLINPIVGVYIPIIRIPSLKVGGFPSPMKRDFWPWHIWLGLLPSQKSQKIPQVSKIATLFSRTDLGARFFDSSWGKCLVRKCGCDWSRGNTGFTEVVAYLGQSYCKNWTICNRCNSSRTVLYWTQYMQFI